MLTILQEFAACCAFLLFLFGVLIFGTAAIPHQPGRYSERVFVEAGQ